MADLSNQDIIDRLEALADNLLSDDWEEDSYRVTSVRLAAERINQLQEQIDKPFTLR